MNSKDKRDLSAEEQRILREHWQWAGRYAIFWVVFTIFIFGGAHLLFDYLGTDDRAPLPLELLPPAPPVVLPVPPAVGLMSPLIYHGRHDRRHSVHGTT